MILRNKKSQNIVVVGQVIPTFFGKLGQVVKYWKPSEKNPAGSVKFYDNHGQVYRYMAPQVLNLEWS